MRERVRLAGVGILVLALSLLAGCWNRRELNTLGIVAGIGIDLADEPGKVLLTAQIVKPAEVGTPQTGGGGGAGEKLQPVWIAKSTGDTVFDAVRNFTSQSPRKLYFSHNEIIVIGKEAAQKGVRPLLDFFVRDPEPRRTAWIMVADGRASDILEAKMELDSIPARGLVSLIEMRTATSEVTAMTLQEFVIRLMSKSTAPVATHVESIGDEKEKRVRLVGTAVFKDDKLVGQLDKPETRGLLWVIGEVKSGIIVVESPGDGGKVSLEITRAKSKITPELRDGKPHIRLEVFEEGNLGGQGSTADLTTPSVLADLEKRQEAAIQGEIRAALAKARELKVDIFGFGDAVHRKYPKEWKKIEPKWEEIFPTVDVEVLVRARVRRVGMITRPTVPR